MEILQTQFLGLEEILQHAVKGYALFNVTFWLSSGICAVLDYVGITKPSNARLKSYGKSLVVSTTNALIGTIPAFLLLGCYEKAFGGEDCGFVTVAYQLGIARILSDVLFYGIHYTLHLNPIYIAIHKLHHQITVPVGISAIYMTISDLYIGNITPLYLPLILIKACPLTIKIWMVGSTLSAVFAHSGMIKDHDLHHSLVNVNYGTSLFMDKLFGTKV